MSPGIKQRSCIINKMKRRKWYYIAAIAALLLLYLGLLMVEKWQLPASFTVENRKDTLYLAEKKISMPQGEGDININTASIETLSTLPGIGAVLAGRIVAYREEFGPFLHPEGIQAVPGIGEKMYEKIKPFIFVQ